MWIRITKEIRFAARDARPSTEPIAAPTSDPELSEQELMDTIAAHRNLLRLLFVVTVAAVILRGPFI